MHTCSWHIIGVIFKCMGFCLMQLIERALNCLIHFTEEFATIDGHESFTRRIAALHVVHHTYQSHLLWFGQLASHMPGVLVTLEHRLPTDSEEMVGCVYPSNNGQ